MPGESSAWRLQGELGGRSNESGSGSAEEGELKGVLVDVLKTEEASSDAEDGRVDELGGEEATTGFGEDTESG